MCDQHKARVRARKKSALLNRAHDSHGAPSLTHVSRAHHEAPEDRPSGAVLEDGEVARHEDARLISDHRTGPHKPRKLDRALLFSFVLGFRPILTGIISSDGAAL